MTQKPTDRIEEIRKRAEAATPGPIESDPGNCLVTVGSLPGEEYRCQIGEFPLGKAGRNDSEFYAHAREDIPWLLEQLSQLQAENDRLASAFQRLDEMLSQDLSREREAVARLIGALNDIDHVLNWDVDHICTCFTKEYRQLQPKCQYHEASKLIRAALSSAPDLSNFIDSPIKSDGQQAPDTVTLPAEVVLGVRRTLQIAADTSARTQCLRCSDQLGDSSTLPCELCEDDRDLLLRLLKALALLESHLPKESK